MRLVVIGCGYVGLVSGACFAELGHEVVCVDSNPERIRALWAGIVPIFEPGLSEMIGRTVEAGRLRFATELPQPSTDFDAAFIAVGTPPSRDGHGAELGQVYAVAEALADWAEGRLLVVTKSTVPVGTGDTIERMIRRRRPDLDVEIVSNPEFLREGNALHDFLEPDRIVVGSTAPAALETLRAIYAPITRFGIPLLQTDRKAAELIKYAANAFLAIKITFINEMADLCEALETDVSAVAEGIGLDGRIGKAFLKAGPGYGGSCFPKDTAALIATAQDWSINLRLVESTVAANDARKRAMARRVIAAMGGTVRNKRIAILGLTFKPDTDDMREAPALALIAGLLRAGARIRAYDPEGMQQAGAILSGVEFAANAYECAEHADGVVLVTEWDEFLSLDYALLGERMRNRLMVDLRNVLDRDRLAAAGFAVTTIGRPAQPAAPVSDPAGLSVAFEVGSAALPLRRVNGIAPAGLHAHQDGVVPLNP